MNRRGGSQLAGLEIDGSEKGLGFNEKISAIYLEHLDEAYRNLSAGEIKSG